MIVFQNKKLLNDVDFIGLSKWLEQVVIREKKILGEIVCVFCDDKYLLEKNRITPLKIAEDILLSSK